MKKITKNYWIEKFRKKLSNYHKKNLNTLSEKLYRKSSTALQSIKKRSKKHNVECTITINDIRNMIINSYGKPCKYFPDRILNYKNIVFDHRIPISLGGPSTKENIQIISKYSNNIKGSLIEEDLYTLIELLSTVNINLRKDILTRLSKGFK